MREEELIKVIIESSKKDIDKYVKDLKYNGVIRQEAEISLMVSVKESIKKHYIED